MTLWQWIWGTWPLVVAALVILGCAAYEYVELKRYGRQWRENR